VANKSLFTSLRGLLFPDADAVNEEMAPAYSLTPRQALAQYAATGCLNATYYASAEEQLKTVLDLCKEIEPEFLAHTAVFCREQGFMKDIPALLCAVLSVKSPKLLNEIFERVIDNGRMLRNFIQILRSGAVRRKSLGTLPKKLVLRWLESRDDETLFRASIGRKPSLADIIKMVHPKPKTPSREALYGYLIGKPDSDRSEALPAIVKHFEAYKAGATPELPNLPFEMLTALELGTREWTEIARNAPWHMTRMNLNTFARHGVFKQSGMTQLIADRLRDEAMIEKTRVFPYQLMVAFALADERVPGIIRDALQDAMEIALKNVPKIEGKLYICPDVSSSMSSPVTGHRKGGTSKVRCIDVAALVAAAMLRKNPEAQVIPFEQDVVAVDLNHRDSVMTNASKLASIGGGGTNCSAPLTLLNKHKAKGDLVVFVSDNESWVDAGGGRGTATMREWAAFKKRNPSARLVCIDIQPYKTTQAVERHDILNVGGFSDQVFNVLGEFAAGRLNPDHWIGVIEAVKL